MVSEPLSTLSIACRGPAVYVSTISMSLCCLRVELVLDSMQVMS